VNRPHLATSLRCTMYDAMWPLGTDAMATSAFFAEACLHMYVVLSTLCRFAQTLSSLFPACRSSRLPCSWPGLPSVEAYRVSGAGHVLSIVDSNDSRRLAKQPVKCLKLSIGRPTSCLYSIVALFM